MSQLSNSPKYTLKINQTNTHTHSDFCIVNARVIYTKNHCFAPGTFLGITPLSSASNGLYFLNLPLVSVMSVIYTSKGMSKKFGVRVIH
jgi:hypothetical protein